MGKDMREVLTFECEEKRLWGTLDGGNRPKGLLIVSGGNEIRVGPHRSMARLAAAVSAAGHPVFRFDRRGTGDSEGDNAGFRAGGPDIAAAINAFRAAVPGMTQLVGFGNCDGASALVLHAPALDALLLANPWAIEPVDDLPPAPAIRARYARRIRDPEAWAALLTGKVDLRAVAKGVGRLAIPKRSPPALVGALAAAFAAAPPATILLAARDNTAIAFADAWKGAAFDHVRDRVPIDRRDTSSHGFAGEGDFDWLLARVLAALDRA